MSNTATVTMPIEQYEAMRTAQVAASKQIEQLQKDLAIERECSDPSGRITELTKALNSALEIVGFAVGNLSPEVIKRWPYNALRVVANGISHLPLVTPREQEMMAEMLKFATEAEQWENKRNRDGERYVPPPANADGLSLG